MRALLVYPTRENCDEVAREAVSLGLNAVVYPVRSTDTTKGENCWNVEADHAEQIGFSVVKAVCPTCSFKTKCEQSGYLSQLAAVKDATVAVCTHKRAEYTGLRELSASRPFVSIHENAVSVLRPECECTISDLFVVKSLLNRILNDPKILDWFGDDLKVDDDGIPYHAGEVKRRKDRLYEFCSYLADIVDDLDRCVTSAEEITEWVVPPSQTRPPGIERLLFLIGQRLQLRFQGQSWRFVLSAAAGELKSVVLVVSDRRSEKGSPQIRFKNLLGHRHNSPCETCVNWFNDATIDGDLLSSLLGRAVVDKTPRGRIELQKKAVQIPRDITRQTSEGVVLGLLRGVLSDRPDFRRIGIIGHRLHIIAIERLEPEFARRIVRTTYFGSGNERSSNAWHRDCDLIVIAGTPRLPPDAIKRYLIQIGRIDAAARGSVWGPMRWKGKSESGEVVPITGRGYRDEEWGHAQRDLVRAALIQSIGRGRGTLNEGCEVLVLSNEECGIPISDSEAKPLNASQIKVLDKLVNLSAVFPNNNSLGKTAVSTKVLSTALEMSSRQVRDILKSLDERGLVLRVGDRGGWLPVSQPSIDRCSAVQDANLFRTEVG